MKDSPLPPLPRLSAEERRFCDHLQKRSERGLRAGLRLDYGDPGQPPRELTGPHRG